MSALVFVCLMAGAVDGDTLRCPGAAPAANDRVRLARIDTPEEGEAGFDAAAAKLAELIDGREVVCRVVDADPRVPGFQRHDRFLRPVARCRAAGVDLGAAMLASGLAVKWPG